MVAEYIESKWGFAAVRNMLGLYKAGKTTEQVFREALSVGLPEFDTQFTKFMSDKVAPIDPSKYGKLLKAGVEALDGGNLDVAITSLKEAVEIYPEYSDDNNAWEPLAEAYLKKGDKAAAADVLKRYLTYSELAFTSYTKLAELLEESGDKAGAAKSLEGAMYVRPMDLKGHAKLGSDRAHVFVLALERECRRARDDPQVAAARQAIDQLLRQAIGEILLVALLAQVGVHHPRRRHQHDRQRRRDQGRRATRSRSA